jgi:hypothetical protein
MAEETYNLKLNLLLIRCRLHIADCSMQLLIAPALAAEDQGPGLDAGRPGCSLSNV